MLVQTINRDAIAAMRDDQVSRSLRDVLLEPAAGSPQEAAAFIARETEQWTKVIADARHSVAIVERLWRGDGE